MMCHPYYIGAAERFGKSTTAMNVLVPATYSDAFVEDPTPVLLSKLDEKTITSSGPRNASSASQPRKRNGQCHVQPIVRELLTHPENWFEINCSDDYQFPGKYRNSLFFRLVNFRRKNIRVKNFSDSPN